MTATQIINLNNADSPIWKFEDIPGVGSSMIQQLLDKDW